MRSRPLLGTFVTLDFTESRPDEATLADAVFFEIERVHHLFSAYADTGVPALIARASAAGARMALAPEAAALLRRALLLAASTDGAFDPMRAGSQLVRAGMRPNHAGDRLPDADAGWSDVRIHADDTIGFSRALAIDLGGIAKGYALDCAAGVLEAAGASATLNAGGDLRFVGDAPRVATIFGPLHAVGSVSGKELRDLPLPALASSAPRVEIEDDTDEFRESSHIVDSRTPGAYCEESFAVTVLAPDCATADALTKAALILPVAQLRRVMRAHRAIALRYDAALRITEIA